MTTRTVDIYELSEDRGWSMRGRPYKTASHALKAVKRADRRAAGQAGAVVTVITWHPITEVGRTVVEALGG